MEERYLEDTVYVSFDGYQLWLRTADGNNQRIALEPGVYLALVSYVVDLKEEISVREKNAGSLLQSIDG